MQSTSTEGGVEGRVLLLGEGERRTIARQGEVGGGCYSKHYLLMKLLLDRTNYLHRFFD